MFKPFEWEELLHAIQLLLANTPSEISIEGDVPGADLATKPGGQVLDPLKDNMSTRQT